MNVLCILKVNYSTEVLKILALAIFFLKIGQLHSCNITNTRIIKFVIILRLFCYMYEYMGDCMYS